MSAGSPPLSETTVAPIQKHSLPVSNKPEVQETNHEEGQLFEKLLQKVWTVTGGRVEVYISSSRAFLLSHSWKKNSATKS